MWRLENVENGSKIEIKTIKKIIYCRKWSRCLSWKWTEEEDEKIKILYFSSCFLYTFSPFDVRGTSFSLIIEWMRWCFQLVAGWEIFICFSRFFIFISSLNDAHGGKYCFCYRHFTSHVYWGCFMDFNDFPFLLTVNHQNCESKPVTITLSCFNEKNN